MLLISDGWTAPDLPSTDPEASIIPPWVQSKE
jgi:hypothetical protein